MQVKDVMTADPACCTAESSLQEVAKLMVNHDCGEIPVVASKETRKTIGVITDRDLALRYGNARDVNRRVWQHSGVEQDSSRSGS